MKVILLADVKNVGKKGEVKEVADGYGRNYLIKNKLAVESTKRSMEILQRQNDKAAADLENKRQIALKDKVEIEKVKLTFKVKVGSDGRIFGSVSTKNITEELYKRHHISVDKRKFLMDVNHISALGEYDLKIELFKDVIAVLKVELVSL